MKEKLQKAVETKACAVKLDDLSRTKYCIDESDGNESVGG
jgi:hypothetical protein